MFQYYRILLGVLLLIIAAYFDFKYRKIHDYVWIPFIIIGFTLIICEYVYNNEYRLSILSILFSIVLGLILTKSKIIGEADGLALITISVLMPLFTSETVSLYFTGLTLMINSLCISLICPIIYLLFNCYQHIKGRQIFSDFQNETNLRKIRMLCLGIRIKSNRLKFGIILEKEVKGINYFDFNSTTKNENNSSQSTFWITPSIPLTIFMLFGFLFLIKYGDLSHYLIDIII